jgi:small-conductance mechanosensitive channel
VTDRQDQSALDLANHVAATVKAHARPWRAIIALVLAIAAGAVSASAGQDLKSVIELAHLARSIVALSTAAGFCLFAVAAVIGLAAKSREVFEPRTGSAHAAVIRYTVMLVGGVITFIITLALLKIPVGQLIVGGALTTIIIGIAAQQSLGNIFAGIVLLLSRPFSIGDDVVLRSGSLGGLIKGTVTEIGITYVRLHTEDGLLHLPNSQVLAAGVGQASPGPQPARENVPAQPAPPGGAAPPSGDAPG